MMRRYLPVKHAELPEPLQGHGLVGLQSVRLPLVFLRAVHVPGLQCCPHAAAACSPCAQRDTAELSDSPSCQVTADTLPVYNDDAGSFQPISGADGEEAAPGGMFLLVKAVFTLNDKRFT